MCLQEHCAAGSLGYTHVTEPLVEQGGVGGGVNEA